MTNYYTAPLQCDEPSCRELSCGLSTHIARDEAGLPLFPACTVPRCKGRMHRTCTDKALDVQLRYYARLFDVDWSKQQLERDNKRRADKVPYVAPSYEDERALSQLCAQANRALNLSAFHTVDFSSLLAQPASGVACAPAAPLS